MKLEEGKYRNIVVTMDSFKGSLTSMEAGMAVKEGICQAFAKEEQPNIQVVPFADGGEGTSQALAQIYGAKQRSVNVTGPLGTPIKATYYIGKDMAIMEMSQAAGITLLKEEEKNPMETTTAGVGDMILDAINLGIRHFIIGIGGSATNDGGVGMLQRLGFLFLDKEGKDIPYGAEGLEGLCRILPGNNNKEELEIAGKSLKELSFTIACDVENPLCGEQGCSAIFSPQKGATPDMIAKMDSWLSRYASLSESINPHAGNLAKEKGAGAAGGLGFAFLTYLNAELKPGAKLIMDASKLEEKIKEADLVITGEGKLDGQSVMGKGPMEIAKLAKKYQKPVIAFAGCIGEGAEKCIGVDKLDAYYGIHPEGFSVKEGMKESVAKAHLTSCVRDVLTQSEYKLRLS